MSGLFRYSKIIGYTVTNTTGTIEEGVSHLIIHCTNGSATVENFPLEAGKEIDLIPHDNTVFDKINYDSSSATLSILEIRPGKLY